MIEINNEILKSLTDKQLMFQLAHIYFNKTNRIAPPVRTLKINLLGITIEIRIGTFHRVGINNNKNN